MSAKNRRAKIPAILSKGGVRYEEFGDVEPTEFKAKSGEERRRDQEEAWKEFDLELKEKLRRNELGVDAEKEVKRNDKA